jgi:hypothetical protein
MSKRVERRCVGCGRIFRGDTKRCSRCLTTERQCVGCGCTFRDYSNLRCRVCRGHVQTPQERECVTCGQVFTSASNHQCYRCRWAAASPAEQQAMQRARHHRRRAARAAAHGLEPVSAADYAAVLASGPCVYCGAEATTVDHVRPLARGGAEHVSNLAPACHPCNSSKRDRLLTEWMPERAAYGVAHSPVVAAEHARLTAIRAALGTAEGETGTTETGE